MSHRSGSDLRYGRGGGRLLDVETRDQAAEREATLRRVQCWCSVWTVAPIDVGRDCHTCETPMVDRS